MKKLLTLIALTGLVTSTAYAQRNKKRRAKFLSERTQEKAKKDQAGIQLGFNGGVGYGLPEEALLFALVHLAVGDEKAAGPHLRVAVRLGAVDAHRRALEPELAGLGVVDQLLKLFRGL